MNVYQANLRIVFGAECEGSAADLVSSMMSEDLMSKGDIIDWEYVSANGQHTDPVDTGIKMSNFFDEGEIFGLIDQKKSEFKEIFTDEFLEEIGFKRAPIKTPDIRCGKAIDKKTGGMTVITWNTTGHSCTYFGDKLPQNVSVGIGKDGGTRTAFNGYVFTQDDVRKALSLSW
jgi:hypothetical protein